jgi:ankyrin repeat protein
MKLHFPILSLLLLAVSLFCAVGAKAKDMINPDYTKDYTNPVEQKMIRAIMSGDVPTLSQLHSAGANLNALGKFDNTPMRVALKCRREKAVLFLLQRGVDPNFVTPRGAVPAFLAAEQDDVSILAILLDHGLNPNIKQDGEPIIFAAIREGQWANLRLLSSRGADVKSRTPNNSTVLLELVGMSQYDLAKALILHGADATIENDAGLTVVKVLVNDQKAFGADRNNINFKKIAELLQLLRDRGVSIPAGY